MPESTWSPLRMVWLAQNPERDLELGSVLCDVEEAELRMIDWNALAHRLIAAIRRSASASTSAR